jgi:hypothetical protein
MGIQKGLKAVHAYKDELARRKEAAEAGKINWLKMEDGESVEMRYLQEIDEGAENYSEKNGIGVFATEHVKPGKNNFSVKAVCSMDDEEACFGCEEHRKDWKAGWKGKNRLYINVLVKRKNGDQEVAMLSTSNGPKGTIAPLVITYAEENNTITDRWWKITRVGTGESTVYQAFVRGPSDDVNPEDYDVQDVDKCYRIVPYAEQKAFFFPAQPEGGDEDSDGDVAAPSDSKTSASVDW